MYDILLRLPPKSVVRCRAVCRSWLRLASDRSFLLAHHRRQRSLPLVYFILNDGRDPEVSEYRLAVFDLRANELQAVVRFSRHGNGWMARDRDRSPWLLRRGPPPILRRPHLFLYNPTTRHWGRLPPLHRDNTIAGLYSHRISDDYWVLYFRRHEDGNYYYYVMAAGTRKQRLVSRQVSPLHSSWHTWFARHTPPVLLHGNSIAVFDTVAEVFRLMPSPAVNVNNQLVSNVKLLDMEGVLAMSSSWSETFGDDGPSRVDLWFLEDYKSNVWVCKYRIELPVEDISRFLGLLDLWTAVGRCAG
ncbi:unnamed protein product [Miscanthus lutarioriparius]|uniref:F-box domain-containing protein n=1 Tax=Miscanthus lutarioriparius TaxID=422564 RepID=A0A811M8X5_9POAL|nr:unnamed protein product [Miscanthus lutarioriparius]